MLDQVDHRVGDPALVDGADDLAVLEEVRIRLEELKVVIRVCKEVQGFLQFQFLINRAIVMQTIFPS